MLNLFKLIMPFLELTLFGSTLFFFDHIDQDVAQQPFIELWPFSNGKESKDTSSRLVNDVI